MAKYLIQGTYTADGVRGLAREGGSGRRKAIETLLAGVKGSIESFYYAFGAADVFVIVDVPDAVSATALSLAVNGSGAVHISLTPLMSAEDMDSAAKFSVSYRAPGA